MYIEVIIIAYTISIDWYYYINMLGIMVYTNDDNNAI